jgi:hypothetical protein
MMADAPAAARGLGLAFAFPDATQWRMAMLNLPVFVDHSPQGFYDRLLASKTDPATGKTRPSRDVRVRKGTSRVRRSNGGDQAGEPLFRAPPNTFAAGLHIGGHYCRTCQRGAAAYTDAAGRHAVPDGVCTSAQRPSNQLCEFGRARTRYRALCNA